MQKLINKVIFILCLFISFQSYALNISIPDSIQNNTSITIIDAKSESTVYSWKSDTPRLIASNMKVITSYVALKSLGPNFTWNTKLAYDGTIKNGILDGNIYLIGSGDPTLSSDNLLSLLANLHKLGIKKINGKLIYNNSIFNSQVKSSELYPEPLADYSIDPSGLLIDQNLSSVRLTFNNHKFTTQPQKIQKYIINSQLVADESSNYSCKDTNNYISASKKSNNIITLSGTVPASCSGKPFKIYLLSNDEYNERVITKLLKTLKIANLGVESSDFIPHRTKLINTIQSESLATLLNEMNQQSNNLYAKTLFLSLGAYKSSNKNTYDDSKNIYVNTLSKFNVAELNNNLENGAGLSRYEQLTTNHMGNILFDIYNSSESKTIVYSLPTPGQDGTLKNELPNFANQLYAKTGSLSDTKAYSGYFFAKNGNIYIISAVINNIDKKKYGSQQLQDFRATISNILFQLN